MDKRCIKIIIFAIAFVGWLVFGLSGKYDAMIRTVGISDKENVGSKTESAKNTINRSNDEISEKENGEDETSDEEIADEEGDNVDTGEKIIEDKEEYLANNDGSNLLSDVALLLDIEEVEVEDYVYSRMYYVGIRVDSDEDCKAAVEERIKSLCESDKTDMLKQCNDEKVNEAINQISVDEKILLKKSDEWIIVRNSITMEKQQEKVPRASEYANIIMRRRDLEADCFEI